LARDARQRGRPALATAACVAGLIAAGCGGSQDQSAQEPRGHFPVTLLDASFPTAQHIAKTSDMVISVQNSGSRTIPDISVTVKCPGSGLGGSFDTTTSQADVANPQRPIFELNSIPTTNANDRPPLDPAPLERTSAYVDTYPLGALKPNQTAYFHWNVTAVKAGGYRLCWQVNAGLNGKAVAVAANGSPPISGVFAGNVSDSTPQAGIGPDGQTVTGSGG
jgi:hypothetical protein